MDDEQVVGEGVSRFGLHWVHVVRMGKAVDVGRWWFGSVPVGALCAGWFGYEEAGLGMHHLRLWWKEAVDAG